MNSGEHENESADVLVKVRAQVMTRDENTQGWFALDGGGLAIVSVRRRQRLAPTIDEDGNLQTHEYIIYGQRISDQSVILSCTINRELKYFKVMPTFHHWRSGKQRNGLTFQTAADARAFDKGIISAFTQILCADNDEIKNGNSTRSKTLMEKYDSIGEDEVFMALDLPVDPIPESTNKQIETASTKNSQTSPDSNGSQKSFNSEQKKKEKERYNKEGGVQCISSDKISIQTDQPPSIIAPGDNYNYNYVQLSVQSSEQHEYNYPIVDEPAVTAQSIIAVRHDSKKSRSSTTTSSPPLIISQPLSPTTIQPVPLEDISVLKDPIIKPAKLTTATTTSTSIVRRKRCRHCHNYYSDEYNPKGACEFAPDYLKKGIECISCLGCARCMMYHCMSDSEGDTPAHPCQCSGESGCTKRWVGLTLLSIFVPCLLCYPPLWACHWIGVSCGVCGGKHKPEV